MVITGSWTDMKRCGGTLCNIDYNTAALMHGVLHREQTVADGGTMCDYWMVGDKVKDPK